MKKWFVLVLCVPVWAMGQKKTEGFVIKATIMGLADNSVVTLTDLNNPTDTVSRAEVKNQSFTMKGSVAEPNLYQLNLNAVQKKAILFLSNDVVTINGSVEKLQELQVSGSSVQKDFNEFQSTFNPLFQKLSELNQQIGSRPNIQPDDSLMVGYKSFLNKIRSSVDEFVANKKSSHIASFLLVVTSELEQDPAVIEKRFNLLDKKIQRDFYGKIVKKQIDDRKIAAVGTEAIPFIQNDTAGNPVSLASYRGKYVLIDFWASWCKPCRMENPNLVTAFNKFKEKNFTVLGVSLDRTREPWLKAIKDDNLTWTQVSDLKYWQNEVAKMYKIESIPQNFLIDPNGKIIAKNLRGDELQRKLCELLGCN